MFQTSENYNNIQEPTNKQNFNKIVKIFHNTNCKAEYTICLMECVIYTLQCVGKNKTPSKIRLNNHWKDVKDPKTILADNTFKKVVIDLTNTQGSR